MDPAEDPDVLSLRTNGEVYIEDTCVQPTGSSEPDSTRPGSTCDSQGQPAPSTAPSLSALSLEERLKRMRAAEELRQQQRYAAYVESQKQAEQARIKAQQERRRKLEEMHQRAEARRSSVLQRRQELEQSNKARLELLRERSRTRETELPTCRRRFTESSAGIGRTASASPSVGSARNPNHLMTTSCVVAFGSSAPRSICTQPSPAALRRQQAFEARLASYLTGRHSGCFLTTSASPYYTHLLDNTHQPLNPSTVAFVGMHSKGSVNSKRHRRAVSAHASISRHTKASLARAGRPTTAAPPSVTVDGVSSESPCTVSKSRSVAPSKRAAFGKTVNQFSVFENEVSHNRSASSQDCHTIGRQAQLSSRVARQHTANKPASVRSAVESCSSSMMSSSRSSSVDVLPKSSNSAHGSVFERLAAQVPKHQLSSKTDTNRSAPTKPSVTSTVTSKKPSDALNTKRPPSSTRRVIPKGMSVSVYHDRTESKAATITKKPIRKRSVSPKPSSATTEELKPTKPLSETTQDNVCTTAKDAVINGPEESEVVEPSVGQTELDSASSSVAEATTEANDSEKPESHTGQPPIPVTHEGPLKAEIQGAGEGGLLKESEAAIYRAKFSEQRRLAKERKEEEQRRFLKAQEQLLLQQEAARLAAEQAERERAEQAEREAAEALRQKEEAEKARLRAAEAERLSKLQRAEEERIKRKQRLENIMSRVKQTPRPPSASSPPSSASTPFLFGQDSHASVTEVPQGDVSDSKLLHYTEAEPNSATEVVDGNSVNPDTGAESPPIIVDSSEPKESSPVRFTLTDTVKESAKPLKAEVESPSDECASEGVTVQPIQATDSQTASSDNPTAPASCADSLTPQSDLPPPDPVAPTPVSVPASPNKVICDNPDESTTTSSKPSAPQFKSALLQSMLGGGRLATRAKDAVAGLRTRSSASQLSDIQPNGDHSDTQSLHQWTQPNPSGDGPLGRYPHSQGSPVQISPNELNGNGNILKSPPSSMVQSMYEGSIDRVHVNGSRSSIPHDSNGDFLDLAKVEGSYAAANDLRPVGSPRYAWTPNADRDIPNSESLTSVPLPTSSN